MLNPERMQARTELVFTGRIPMATPAAMPLSIMERTAMAEFWLGQSGSARLGMAPRSTQFHIRPDPLDSRPEVAGKRTLLGVVFPIPARSLPACGYDESETSARTGKNLRSVPKRNLSGSALRLCRWIVLANPKLG